MLHILLRELIFGVINFKSTKLQSPSPISSPLLPPMDSSFNSSEQQQEPDLVETRNWLDLPHDVTMTILMKLSTDEILESAQFVCKLWYGLCKDPAMYRIIDFGDFEDPDLTVSYQDMIFDAVSRSSGGLIEINIELFASDKLISYIAERAKSLKCLRLRCCSSIGDDCMIEAMKQLPLLEEVQLTLCSFSQQVIRAIGFSCPQLKSFKLNGIPNRGLVFARDKYAFVIAESMPHLSHLQLIGNDMTRHGLQATLDNCHNLVSLDLRACFQINMSGSLGARCHEQIELLYLPDEPTTDYPFVTDYGSDHVYYLQIEDLYLPDEPTTGYPFVTDYVDYLHIVDYIDMSFMKDEGLDELYSLSNIIELLG